MRKICSNCHWSSWPQVYKNEAEINNEAMYKCQRHAPVVTGGMMTNVSTIWPSVKFDDSCGDFSLRASNLVKTIEKDSTNKGEEWYTTGSPVPYKPSDGQW